MNARVCFLFFFLFISCFGLRNNSGIISESTEIVTKLLNCDNGLL